MPSQSFQRPSAIQRAFLTLFFLLFIALNILCGVYLVHWRSLVSLAQFFILQVINVGVAYGLTEFVLSLVVPQRDLPRLGTLPHQPAIAILYVTCDDVIPGLLAQLKNQTYSNYQVYVLDDSSRRECKAQVDSSGFTVVRRGSRKGFKAGNLNHWLSLYGRQYEYFVVVDSDSVLPPHFLEQMLRYAEHSANQSVATFQSKIKIWNTGNYFARVMAAWFPVWFYPIAKLGNLCNTVLSWGHNCLHRTDLILSVGGFDERFIAEDYATSVKLLQAGHNCQLVDIVSYEAMPPSPRAYVQRAVRWAKQTLQLFELDTTGLPTTTKLHILANAWSFVIWLLYIPGMLLATWGSQSTFHDLANLAQWLIRGHFIHTPLALPLSIITFYNVYFLLLRYPLCRKLGIGFREYWGTLILLLALGPYMALPLVVNQLGVLLSIQSPTFTVTPKVEKATHLWKDVADMWHVFIWIIVVLTGILRNPVAIVFNFAWLVPLIFSPVVLLLVRQHQAVRIQHQYEPTWSGSFAEAQQ